VSPTLLFYNSVRSHPEAGYPVEGPVLSGRSSFDYAQDERESKSSPRTDTRRFTGHYTNTNAIIFVTSCWSALHPTLPHKRLCRNCFKLFCRKKWPHKMAYNELFLNFRGYTPLENKFFRPFPQLRHSLQRGEGR